MGHLTLLPIGFGLYTCHRIAKEEVLDGVCRWEVRKQSHTNIELPCRRQKERTMLSNSNGTNFPHVPGSARVSIVDTAARWQRLAGCEQSREILMDGRTIENISCYR